MKTNMYKMQCRIFSSIYIKKNTEEFLTVFACVKRGRGQRLMHSVFSDTLTVKFSLE